MLTSLSRTRLTSYSKVVGEIASFIVLASRDTPLGTQIYVVPTNYKDKTRTEPLAHIYKLGNGKIKFHTFQPELYNLQSIITRQYILEGIESIVT